jgi:3-dehydroquinate dehydratase/shikimate dehydrogenase
MSAPQIVEAVKGVTMAELRTARDRATAGLVELRLDSVADPDVAGALEGRRTPVILTIRSAAEGGWFKGGEEERLRMLGQAVELGAEFVDVEWRADRRALPRSDRTKLVLSHHDFTETPADLADRVRAMQSEAPDVLKIAVTANRLRDVLALHEATAPVTGAKVAIAMGAAGGVTRTAPALWGSCWTFAGSTAPGQFTVDDLADTYRVERQTARTTLYAVTGAPLGHSASPAMHNAAFRALGMDAVYVALETADADELLEVGDALGLLGASVTAPLKPSMFARTIDHDELARQTGAVNTVRRRPEGWQGRNYDVAGFLSPLASRRLDGARAVVLGAGGAARTAVWALKARGARVEVTARRNDRAEALAAGFQVDTCPWPPRPGWDLLVNTTPVGTWPQTDESPLDRARLSGGCVYDLVYNPEETQLLRWAREAGIETIGGLEMLVGQACLQFEWWTGRLAPREVMLEGARAFLARARRS